MLRIAALSGSLRRGSFTTALLRIAAAQAPGGTQIAVFDRLGEIPPYNEDIRMAGEPEPVTAMRGFFDAADALIMATPEYNRSFSGVLKNALDWLSRPPSPPLAGKAALVMTASPGAMGGGLANYHLRQTLSVMGVHVLPGREFALGEVASRFDADLVLRDDAVLNSLRSAIGDLANMAMMLARRNAD